MNLQRQDIGGVSPPKRDSIYIPSMLFFFVLVLTNLFGKLMMLLPEVGMSGLTREIGQTWSPLVSSSFNYYLKL